MCNHEKKTCIANARMVCVECRQLLGAKRVN